MGSLPSAQQAQELSQANSIKNKEKHEKKYDERQFRECQYKIKKAIKSGKVAISHSALGEQYNKILIDKGYEITHHGLDMENTTIIIKWDKSTS